MFNTANTPNPQQFFALSLTRQRRKLSDSVRSVRNGNQEGRLLLLGGLLRLQLAGELAKTALAVFF